MTRAFKKGETLLQFFFTLDFFRALVSSLNLTKQRKIKLVIITFWRAYKIDWVAIVNNQQFCDCQMFFTFWPICKYFDKYNWFLCEWNVYKYNYKTNCQGQKKTTNAISIKCFVSIHPTDMVILKKVTKRWFWFIYGSKYP